MMYFTLFILFCLFVFSYYRSRSILHPATTTSLLWLLILTVYNFSNVVLFDLSCLFYKSLLLWCVPFCIVSLILGNVNFYCSPYLKNVYSNVKILDRIVIYVYLILFLSLILLIQQGLSVDSENIVSGYRNYDMTNLNEKKSIYESILHYGMNISLIFVLARMFYSDNIVGKSWKIAFLLLIVFFVIKAQKSNFILIFLFLLCFYLKKGYKRKIFYIFLFTISLLVFVSILRAGVHDIDFGNFIQIYTMSSLPAFDTVLLGETVVCPNYPGEFTFNMITRLFYGNRNDLFSLERWVSVPLPTNVYTVMFNYYVDFGYLGIFIFSVLMGTFWRYLYSFFRRNISCFVFVYSILYYILVNQFYSDSFSLFTSRWIQYILLSIFLFLRFKKV